MAIFCISLGLVYSKLFNTSIEEYLPFLTVGFIVWGLISGLLGEFPNIYVENAGFIKDIKINPFTILFRLVARHIITLLHNLLIVVGVYLYFRINPGLVGLLVFPGFMLVLLNLIAIGVSLSLFGARFRDVAPISQSLIQVLFFITPITWFPRLLPEGSWITDANPFSYFLDLTRSPLLGQLPATQSWFVASGSFLAFTTLALWMYKTKAQRIPFWV
jgi:ABC-type polysaccharide/polyol phosphate export permease